MPRSTIITTEHEIRLIKTALGVDEDHQGQNVFYVHQDDDNLDPWRRLVDLGLAAEGYTLENKGLHVFVVTPMGRTVAGLDRDDDLRVLTPAEGDALRSLQRYAPGMGQTVAVVPLPHKVQVFECLRKLGLVTRGEMEGSMDLIYAATEAGAAMLMGMDDA